MPSISPPYNVLSAIPLELEQVLPSPGDPDIKSHMVRGCVNCCNIKARIACEHVGVMKTMCIANSRNPVRTRKAPGLIRSLEEREFNLNQQGVLWD